MTIEEAYISVLSNTTEDIIPLNILLKIVSKLTGYSTESVRGSSLGLARDKFVNKPWFKDNWIYQNKTKMNVARVIKLKYAEEHNLIYNNDICYNTIEKQNTRKFIFSDIEDLDSPNILTLAGEEGLDVKYILNINKNATIYNIEKNKTVYDKYCKLNLPTINFNGSVTQFLLNNKKKFDIFSYDSIGYLCEYISNDLYLINESKCTKFLYLNLMNIKKIRNHGNFSEYLRKNYGHLEDPTFSYIVDVLSNYNFVVEYVYNRTDNNSQKMRIMKFELK